MVEGKGGGGEGDRRKARRQAFFRAYLIVELLGHSDDAGLGLLPQESMGRGLSAGSSAARAGLASWTRPGWASSASWLGWAAWLAWPVLAWLG